MVCGAQQQMGTAVDTWGSLEEALGSLPALVHTSRTFNSKAGPGMGFVGVWPRVMRKKVPYWETLCLIKANLFRRLLKRQTMTISTSASCFLI